MKKILLAVIITAAISAGITLEAKAQVKVVNIESVLNEMPGTRSSTASTETPIYDKKGKLLYTVKRYDESGLPKAISRMVRNQFYDFDIAGVEEVVRASDNSSVYFVHIVNEKNIKTVKVYNNESEVISEYRKG